MAVAPTNQKALLRLSPTYCLIETVLIGKKRKKKKRSQIHLWGSPSNFTTGSGSSWTESVKDGVEWATDIDIKCASGVGATGAGCAG